MILLVPEWAHNYSEFWNTIRRRNIWFIRLRYLAIISLIIFLLVGEYVLNFNFSELQVKAILTTAVIILIYNSVIHLIRPKVSIEPARFNSMHLSLIQMLFDLFALMYLIHYTGTIDSPLFVFFIFHMVIGSMILPSYLIYIICGVVIIVFGSMVTLQHENLLASHRIEGLYLSYPEHTDSYYFLFIVVFTAMMVITVLITNRMARNLLKREEQLRKTLNELHEAEAAKQRYIMGVVHEIKSPVSAVRSIIDLILTNLLGPLNEQVSQKLLRAKNRTDQALELINDIVKLSKLRLLSSTETKKLFLDDLIKEYVDEHTDDLKSKNIYVEIEDLRDARFPIVGDKDLINLAISNLLSNAAKYVDENGRVRMEIDEFQGNIRLRLMDNGIGIPKEDLKQIFQQFYRASNIKKRRSEGTGLGLSLVKEIILHHNGSIAVDSPSEIGEEGKPGTCFTIILPYLSVSSEDSDNGNNSQIRES